MVILILIILGAFAFLSFYVLDLKVRVDYLEDNLPEDKEFWGRFHE